MATEQSETRTVYKVYCRECGWRSDGPVDLKGTANLLAGRHISRTGHVVALKTVETDVDDPADDFHRGRRSVGFEVLRPAGASARDVRRCGPVNCVVETG